MVIPKLPKLEPWVRFPSPAPSLRQCQATQGYKIRSSRFTRTVTRGELENRLCNSHTLCAAVMAIAIGGLEAVAALVER